MIRLWQFLWHGCWHEWERDGRVVDHYDCSFGGRSFIYTTVPVRCAKCGRRSAFKDKSGGAA